MILTIVILSQGIELSGLGYLLYEHFKHFKTKPSVPTVSHSETKTVTTITHEEPVLRKGLNATRPLCVGGCNRQLTKWTNTDIGPVCNRCLPAIQAAQG